MDGSMAFARWCQCAPLPNTCFIGPTRVQISNSIAIGHGRESLYCTTGLPSPWNSPFPQGDLYSHLIQGLFGPTESWTQTASPSVQPLFTAHSRASPYFIMGYSFPLKIAPSHEWSGPPSNAWFLRSTRVLNSNGISIGSAVFPGLTTVTDRQTTLYGL